MSVRRSSGPLQTERRSDGNRALLRDFTVVVEGHAYTVPEKAITDYSTIPWFGRFLVRWSKVDIAGVIHDCLYQTGHALSRSQADRVWRIVAKAGEHRANWIQAWIGWASLRVGGWIAWNRYRSEDGGREAEGSES